MHILTFMHMHMHIHMHTLMHMHMHAHAGAARVSRPPVVDTSTLSPTGAVVQWEPPEDNNGVITGYVVNVVAISTDPMATGGEAGTGGGAGGGNRRRRLSTDVATECIVGGGERINVNYTVGGNVTSLQLDNLSKLLK